jgi:lipoate-protein ligase A
MPHPVRVIDTGLRDGRANVAFDQALIELHRDGVIGDTIRFLRFPPTVLVGRHQAIGREVRLDHCRANAIGIGRRITGGGALYLDEGQLGWEVVLSRKRVALGTLTDYTKAICEAVAQGLSRGFGIEARYRPRSDIEVDGQKICGTGGFFDGGTLFYQGIIPLELNFAAMLAALNIPAPPPPAPGAVPERPRVTTLKALLGGVAPDVAVVQQAIAAGLAAGLDLEPTTGVASAAEEAHARHLLETEIGRDDFVMSIDDPGGGDILTATHQAPGGRITAHLRLEGAGSAERLREVLLTGDFFVQPPRFVLDLEAALRGVESAAIAAIVAAHFAAHPPALASIGPADVTAALEAALAAGR